jgi:hypothetical protein
MADSPTLPGHTFAWPDNASVHLDKLKLMFATAILERHSIADIRAKCLENLFRWKSQGVWNSGYEEWEKAMQAAPDDHLRYLLTSTDEEPANRLRQSPPYVGLLTQAEVEAIRSAWRAEYGK